MLLENKPLDLAHLVGSFSGGKSSLKVLTRDGFQVAANKSVLVLFSRLVREAVASVGCCTTVTISVPEVSSAALWSLLEILEYGRSYTDRYSSQQIEEIIVAARVMGVDLADLKVEETDSFDENVRKETITMKGSEIEKLIEMDKPTIKQEYSEVTVKEETSDELILSVEVENSNKDMGKNNKEPPSKRARTEVTPTPTDTFPEPTPTTNFHDKPGPQFNQQFNTSPQSIQSNNQSPYQFGSRSHNLQTDGSQFQISPQFGSPVPLPSSQSMQRMVPIQSSSNGSPSMVPIQYVSNTNYFKSQTPGGSNYPVQQTGPQQGERGQSIGGMMGQMGTRQSQPFNMVQQVPCTGPCCPQAPVGQRHNVQTYQTKPSQDINKYNQQSYPGTNTSYQPKWVQTQYKKNQNIKPKSSPWNLMNLDEKRAITCPDWNRGNCTREGKGDDYCFHMGKKLRHACSRVVDKDRICWGKHRENFHQG